MKPLINDVSSVASSFRHLQDARSKNKEWCSKVKIFSKDISKSQTKRSRPNDCTFGRPHQTLSNDPCEKVQRSILMQTLSAVEEAAEDLSLSKDEFLMRMIQQAFKSRDWDLSSFLRSLEIETSVPVENITTPTLCCNSFLRTVPKVPQLSCCIKFLLL